nr:MAG TPA_asm: hypothetical protein [Caudoviricetes sp.]
MRRRRRTDYAFHFRHLRGARSTAVAHLVLTYPKFVSTFFDHAGEPLPVVSHGSKTAKKLRQTIAGHGKRHAC